MRIFIYTLLLIALTGLFLFYSYHQCCFQFSPTTENILIGLFTSFVTVIALDLIKAINFFIDFNWISGNDWFEHGINIFDNYTATVEITYKDRNILKVKLTEKESKNVWQGTLTMHADNKVRGEIAWNYPDLKQDKRFGLKQIIITKDNEYDYIYLMSLNFGMDHYIKGDKIEPPYGNMIFRRKRKT